MFDHECCDDHDGTGDDKCYTSSYGIEDSFDDSCSSFDLASGISDGL